MEYRVRYGHPDDPELLSSVNQIEGFKEHVTWRDIQVFLRDRIKGFQEALVHATEMSEVIKLQQSIKSHQDLLELPDQLITWIESEDLNE